MDDLEARLDELSRAGEPRGADAIWHAARRKLRRRRMVRAGALATTAVLLVAVIGVVVRDNRDSDVATPSDTTTSTTTPEPIGTEGRLASTIELSGQGQLTPPKPSDIPAVSALAALRPATPNRGKDFLDFMGEQEGVRPAVRLARCTACVLSPLKGKLVWAVIFNGVVGMPPQGFVDGPVSPSESRVSIWFVDAETGAGGEGLEFGPPLTAAQLACQGGCTPLVPPTSNEPADEVLTLSGACGDALFWAANAEETVAVTVIAEARERSATEPTVIDFALPDPKVQVEIQRGRGLVQSFCNDVINGNTYKVDSTEGAARAEGRITLAPRGTDPYQCGAIKGTLHLDELVAEDGTRIDVPTIVSQSIGCYAG